ncbi:hypothetical protein NIES22_61670 [Calothrix brevissima NIES-22]|nr:hypothetical protein NIES22_61670 [Calothrix brevissima NIES-22]
MVQNFYLNFYAIGKALQFSILTRYEVSTTVGSFDIQLVRSDKLIELRNCEKVQTFTLYGFLTLPQHLQAKLLAAKH